MNLGGEIMDKKILNLLEKMYNELQEMKTEISDMKIEINDIKTEIQTGFIRLENKMDENYKALHDVQKQFNEGIA